MTESWTLIEPCCGTAALTLHLIGAKRHIVPCQGSKWRHRKEIELIVRHLGFDGPPAGVHLHDVGPFGITMPAVLSTPMRTEIIDDLNRFMNAPGGLEVCFNRLQHSKVPPSLVWFAAEHLFLQRLSFSGKAVGLREMCWVSPGFNKVSAYGTPATDKFGEVKPMLPSLIKTLESYDEFPSAGVVGSMVASVDPGDRRWDDTLVYLDPPYQGTTDYISGKMTRAELTDLARRWHASGAVVMVSEAEAVRELTALGWEAMMIHGGRDNASNFKGKQQEWVTCSVPS